MSERIYSLLLRLFPARFRQAYGDAALQMFRDRYRDEQGLVLRVRLWLDLLGDLAVSVPREHLYSRPLSPTASANRHVAGIPSFSVFEEEKLRPEVLVFGALASLIGLVALSLLLGISGNQREFLVGVGYPAPQLDTESTYRRRVIEAAAAILRQHYILPEVGRKMADSLLEHEKNGDDNRAADGEALASLLTQQMRDVSQDRHLVVVYSAEPLPDRPSGPAPEVLADYRREMKQSNCTFEQVKILPNNIGYLKLNSFPDPSICRETAVAAMSRLNRAEAVIFDLRDNRGGQPETVALIAAYLFDHPEYLYNPRENTTEQSWTQSRVPGNRLADKPAYILTSTRTYSGAEQFSYDLKMLKRATLVGETTGGGAHSGVFHRIDDHFGMGVPETRSINPFSKQDWEGTGVEPDVRVNASDALSTAMRLAANKLTANKLAANEIRKSYQ